MKQMSFDDIDATNSWKYLNFINSENASVMVVAMKSYMHIDLPGDWLIEAYVSGRLFQDMTVRGKLLTTARIYLEYA